MSFTPNKNIETPAHGADVNTWDVNANSNFTIIDTCFSGTLLLNATGLSGGQALTQTQVQPPTIQISGAPTAAITYLVPAAIGGVWVVRNTTSGGFQVGIASAAGGATILIPAGQQLQVWCDGSVTGMLPSISTTPPSAFTGVVLPFAGSTAPSWALFCDGSVVSQTTYAPLFAVIGTAYNTGGEGAGNFRLPDLRGRTPYGLDNMNGTATQNRLNFVGASTVRGTGLGNQSHNHGPGATSMDGPNSNIVVEGSAVTNPVVVAFNNHGHQNVIVNSQNTASPGLMMNYIIGI